MPTHAGSKPCTLFDLPVELLSSLAEHFPLYSLPQGCLYLALVSRRLHEIFLPILHSHLILRNEKDALSVLQRIIDDPSRGSPVKGIHIYSQLSPEIRKAVQEGSVTELDVVKALEKVITSGSTPFLSTLELHLDRLSWWHDGRREPFSGFGELREPFWSGLRRNCPRLNTVILSNIGDSRHDTPWVNESGIFQIGVNDFFCRRKYHS
jgi:hypothetical protein